MFVMTAIYSSYSELPQIDGDEVWQPDDFPLFFVHKEGFHPPGYYLYVRLDDPNKAVVVRHDGVETVCGIYTELYCRSCVNRGVWREITKEEAARILKEQPNA